MVRHRHDGRPLRAQGLGLPQLGDRRRAPGPTGEGGFRAEAGRYHLYVSLACPWAHRTLIGRALKGLEDAISVSVVDPHMGAEGWVFGDTPGATPDPIHDARRLYEVYLAADPSYTGRVTVPVLWDRQRATIVSNESAEILRMLNDAFGGAGPDLYPEDLRAEIDAVNARVYDRVNNGVYKAGFATTQDAYAASLRRRCSPNSTRWRSGSTGAAICAATV